jgi:Peptidase family M23
MSLGLPVTGATITSHFAVRNLVNDYPYFHRSNLDAAFSWYFGAVLQPFHAGTDFAAPRGTPIHASEDGLVVYASWAPGIGTFAGGGHVVDVKIDGGMHYVSNHCDTLNVAVGARVKRGQQIATVGDTGNAAGVHDHFALYTDNPLRLRNPEDYLPGGQFANSPLILPAHLPDTSTEDDSLTTVILTKYPGGELRSITFKAGTTVSGYSPTKAVPVKTQKFTADSTAHSDGAAVISHVPDATPRGNFHHITDGIYAGLYIPVNQVTAGPAPVC